MQAATKQQPRIAVIGGGIAGSLCSLVLKNRGLHPVILERHPKHLGGRMSQFLRVSDPRMTPVMAMLQQARLVQEWKSARYGMLGSSGGGFLPSEIVATLTNTGSSSGDGGSSGILGLAPAASDDPLSSEQENSSTNSITDGGDFCNFVQGSASPLFMGIPNNASLCPQICQLANIENHLDHTVSGATMMPGEGWNVQFDNTGNTNSTNDNKFDGMVVATHDPALASSMVQSIMLAEQQAKKSEDDGSEEKKSDDSDQWNYLVERLTELSTKLLQVSKHDPRPLYAVMADYHCNKDNDAKQLPFDAVSVPGSQQIQYLARESSKPGYTTTTNHNNNNDKNNIDTWTAISTSQLAVDIMNQQEVKNWTTNDQDGHTARIMAEEMTQLLAPYYSGSLQPTNIRIQKWNRGLNYPGLGLKEECITLAQWRLAICGDYIKSYDQDTNSSGPSNRSSPWEAAALSGLEAGERMASLFMTQEEENA